MTDGEPTERFKDRKVRVANPEPINAAHRGKVGMARVRGRRSKSGDQEIEGFITYMIDGVSDQAMFLDKELELAE